MTVDSYAAPPSNDEKLQLHADHSRQDSGRASKSRRLLQSTSILYPILLALLLLTGTLFLVVTITRRNTCRHAQEERVVVSSHGLLSNDHVRRKSNRRTEAMILRCLLDERMGSMRENQPIVSVPLPCVLRCESIDAIALRSHALAMPSLVPTQCPLLVPPFDRR